MDTTTEYRVFDLHCDTLTTGMKAKQGLYNNKLQLALDRIPQNYKICQCMAVFMPDTLRGEAAEEYFKQIYCYYQQQLFENRNCMIAINEDDQLADSLEKKDFVTLLTVEGGSVLAGKVENLYYLHECGVKMMTLTWNGSNEICGGIKSGEGFSSFGREAVSLMEELGIVVDVSHLSDKGFGQLCSISRRPFVASHSNSRTVCPNPRNLTDDMFREICRRGGLVGINYYIEFIKQGGSFSIDDLLRHVHHFLELGGEHALALGSDFDGADLPPYLTGIESLPVIWNAFSRSGIPEATINAIFFENAFRFFTQGR